MNCICLCTSAPLLVEKSPENPPRVKDNVPPYDAPILPNRFEGALKYHRDWSGVAAPAFRTLILSSEPCTYLLRSGPLLYDSQAARLEGALLPTIFQPSLLIKKSVPFKDPEGGTKVTVASRDVSRPLLTVKLKVLH